MAEYKKVKVIYKEYHGFPLRVVEIIKGQKMIDRQRISGLKLYKHTPDNLKKGNEANEKLGKIKKLENEIWEIEKSMDKYEE